MSKLTAASDLDYLAELAGDSDRIARTCTRCGGEAWASKAEPYQVQCLCDRCWQLASETQERKMTQIAVEAKARTA